MWIFIVQKKNLTALVVAAAKIALTVNMVLAQSSTRTENFTPYLQVRFKASSSSSSSTSSRGETIGDYISMLPTRIQQQIVKFERLFSLSDDDLDRFRSVAPNDLPDLKLWSVIRLSNPTVSFVERFANELNKIAGVDIVNVITRGPPPPPVAPTSADSLTNTTKLIRSRRTQATPDYQYLQKYLNAAPDGIDAKYMWNLPGGTGSNVKVYDIEYGWDQKHEDLTAKAAGIPVLVSDGYYYSRSSPNHGTAVLGELIGDASNTFGVSGIVPESRLGLGANWVKDLVTNWWTDRTADVILLALNDGSSGDVILLEAQTWVCNSVGKCGSDQVGCGPVEWDDAVYDAIRTAVANNVAVVEAAGNGKVNLDQRSCQRKFDRTKRDSGAIIVGAGAPPDSSTPRSILSFSDYGSRVDLQGYGSLVATTGYGDLQNVKHRKYTETFGGTSSASPIVAGAVASIQSNSIYYLGAPLPPRFIRTVSKHTLTHFQ
jgi:Subtilase family